MTLDDRELPRALIGVSQPIDPGEHVVVVRAGGRERKEKLSLSEGEARELPLSLADGGVAPGPSPEPSPVPDGPDDGPDRPSEGDGSVLEPIGWTAVAVGAAGLVVGAVTGGLAVAKKSDLDTACPGGACEPEFHGDVDSFETLRTTSTAVFVVGGVLAGTGITLVIAAAVSSDDGQAHITPIVAPGGGGLMWHGSF